MLQLKKFIPFIWIVLLVPVLSLGQNTGQPNSREDLERRKRELQKEIDDANDALRETKKSTKENMGQLRALRDKIVLRTRLIENINGELGFINEDISNASRDVKTLQKDLDTLKAQYAQLVVYAYKNRSTYDMMNFIFSAQNFNDAIKRYQYLKQYREYRRRQADNIVETEQQLQAKIGNLQNQKLKRADALKNEEQERQTLEADKKEKDMVVNDLKGREKELLQAINQRKKEAAEVQSAIRAVIRREIEEARRKAAEEEIARKKAEDERRAREKAAREAAAAQAARDAAAAKAAAAANKVANKPADNKPDVAVETPPSSTVSKPAVEDKTAAKPARAENWLEATPEALALSESFEANQGKLPWPVDAGHIINHFGLQQHPVNVKIVEDFDGVVIATNRNGRVKAVFGGDVAAVAVVPGAGYVVMIRHGQYFTNYVRLASVSVKKGDKIKTGQSLGVASYSEEENAGIVELQIWKGTQKQNPERWILRR
ncbi:Septal ring factor EnvC, activator of murein hydrolases AmiA and AmiB [Chitinophaga costaii]|uniref:Septal ring factor EnvC, activator of murein hydrolases AmiA and AmiB n=1 Tax=Chitinophaga costaii TaxID=1335309 RepID=A0A1C4F9D6_9BACT|nr:M23 family metallopeptidase [Chitinophaga costaii]PUZ21172.1 hypothetical protein DCM91_16625 [Chitinophaga costaii]SCC52462.1 Septal ring factor EnvC, activator of murein hydrolases AmiA and AmiB [Chitinophaga costaii]